MGFLKFCGTVSAWRLIIKPETIGTIPIIKRGFLRIISQPRKNVNSQVPAIVKLGSPRQVARSF